MNKTLFLQKRNLFCTVASEETLEFALSYKPADDDLVLVSYPKAGSNWTAYIVKLIVNDGLCDTLAYRALKFSHTIEVYGKTTVLKPLIATELPYDFVPKNPLAKYLYVFRNPKDTVVSYYHHMNNYMYLDEEMDFRQFFRVWLSGHAMDYFEHVYNYWRHRMDGKSDYVVYEQMQRNPKAGVLKIANFLGKEFVDKLLANNELLLNEVLKKSSIDYMRSNSVINEEREELKPFLRKGVVGDWRSHLTRDESDLIDAKFAQYFADTELETIWRDDMKWL